MHTFSLRKLEYAYVRIFENTCYTTQLSRNSRICSNRTSLNSRLHVIARYKPTQRDRHNNSASQFRIILTCNYSYHVQRRCVSV